MRISSPPFLHPCYFGTDIKSRENLIAANHSVEEIAEIIGVDSLGFLGVDNVTKLADNPSLEFCTSCFTGHYPVPVPDNGATEKFSHKIRENSDMPQNTNGGED